MPGIDKAAFLKRIGTTKPTGYGDAMPGESAEEDAAPGEESDEGMTCGEQLVKALGIEGADVAAVDAALREAVAKYK